MPRKVLIVDDDTGVQKSLGRILKLKGFHVTAASSVADALALIDVNGNGDADHAYDVAIIDLNLPDGTGVEVLTALRALSAPPRIAVWTGGAPPAVLQHVGAFRPDAAFLKPRDVVPLIAWAEEVTL